MDISSQAKARANMLIVPIMLVLMLAIPIIGAAGLFCKTCDTPVITLEVVGGLWPGQVAVTATLFSIKVPESSNTDFLVESIQSGKVSVDKLKEMAEVTFLKDKDIAVNYSYTDAGGEIREIALCPVQKTNADGIIKCSATISQSGCGTIIVRYVSDDPLLASTETSASHCVRGEIPFGVVVDQGACLAMFLVLGILIASLYASGKSPLSTLDITTPKRPSGYGYWPGFLSSKYKLANLAKRKAALSAAALGTSLMMDKAITKKQLLMMSMKNKLGGNYESLVKTAIKTNPDRVKQVNMITARLGKLYTIAGSQNVMLGKMTSAEKRARMEVAREITGLENERNRKLSIINQVNAALKSRMVPVDVNSDSFKQLTKLADDAKRLAAAAVAKGGDATMALNAKMKELAAAAVIANLAKDNPYLAELDDLKMSIARLKSQDKSTILMSRKKFEDLASEESVSFLKTGEPMHPEHIKSTGKEKNVKVSISELEKMIRDREKEINKLKGSDESRIDMFTPILASMWKTELAENGLKKELEIENRKPAASQDNERKAFIDKNIAEMRSERQRMQGLMDYIGTEISSSEDRLKEAKKMKKLAKKVDDLKQEVGSIREDIPSSIKEDIWQRKLDIRDHEREISRLEKKGAPEEDIRAKQEVLSSERSYLDMMKNKFEKEKEALKAAKKDYNSEYGKELVPGIPSIPGTEAVVGKLLETPLLSMVKSEKEKAFGNLMEYERKELGARIADSLVTKGTNEAIRTAGTIEAAKLRLGVDIEKEGLA